MILQGKKWNDVLQVSYENALAYYRAKQDQYGIFKFMRKEEYDTNIFEVLESVNVSVMADRRTEDSERTEKTLDDMKYLIGKINIVGTQKTLNETQTRKILNDWSKNAPVDVIARTLDVRNQANIDAIFHRLNYDFYRTLSLGVVSITSIDNGGNNVNLDGVTWDYQIPTANKFGVKTQGKLTLEDIDKVMKASKSTVRSIFMDATTFDTLAQDEGLVKAYAASKNSLMELGSLLPDQVNEYMDRRYKATIYIMDETFTKELQSGHKQDVEGWKAGTVTFTPSSEVGAIAHTQTVEAIARNLNPNDKSFLGIQDLSILLRNYSVSEENKTFKIWTMAETHALPVLENSNGIYQIDTTKIEA